MLQNPYSKRKRIRCNSCASRRIRVGGRGGRVNVVLRDGSGLSANHMRMINLDLYEMKIDLAVLFMHPKRPNLPPTRMAPKTMNRSSHVCTAHEAAAILAQPSQNERTDARGRVVVRPWGNGDRPVQS